MSVVLIPYIGHVDTLLRRFWLGVITEPFYCQTCEVV